MTGTPPLAYAETDEGYRLPVIDTGHPRFAVGDDPVSIAELCEAYEAQERQNRRVPAFIMRFILRRAARRSRLLQAVVAPEREFLGGLSTYVMKLGAENLLPPFDSEIDRRVAASPHLVGMRLRLQQTAKLLARGLAPRLAAAPAAPLELLNIGGGPAIDSLNALILLQRQESQLLRRQVTVRVLDLDAAGPRFGAVALAALSAPEGPLAGTAIAFEHRVYDWNEPALLDAIVHEAGDRGAILVGSSEGGLFEYGSDAAIVANLAALHAEGRGACLVAGTVTRADKTRRRTIARGPFKLVPRGLDGFAPLAQRGGFRIARTEPGPLSDQVLLCPAGLP